ncbi:MAG: sodium:proton antiporter [Lautropia sp.]|nr:sodium:proton antiporter [Lautropia sp.]
MRMAPRISLPLLLLLPLDALAAGAVDGANLSIWWGLPFAGILLSIALIPLVAPHFWHHHFGKIAAFWAVAFLVPFSIVHGPQAALYGFVHAAVAEYIPFILLLTALFTCAGGIHISGNLKGSPALNTGILALGTCLASFMGTTGASMLLIRPLIRANDNRRHQAHVIVFFIFLVSNVGGALTPLGDPPLFLGFLKGVEFTWTLKHLWKETLVLSTMLLVMFFLLDSWLYRKEGVLPIDPTPTDDINRPFGVHGWQNVLLLGCVVGLVLMSGIWKSPVSIDVYGTPVPLPSLVRDVGLIVIIAVSLMITPKSIHEDNQFSWAPMEEVAKLFAGIFLTIIPVIEMLKAGVKGPFSIVVQAVTNEQGEPIPLMYFWTTGVLSSFLDNAPTYLVFFNSAGGDPNVLMTTLAPVLAAISAGAVFMGANTYIGNAPNLMVKAIAEDRGIKMPSFFGYILWSLTFLLPLFLIMSLITF